ncbi:MAG TPA: hypothetical protein VJX70_14325 [Candidatus Acidoferrum sp.]|nr:hypothetical protein [Candidatus Acidoferrum sp.]
MQVLRGVLAFSLSVFLCFLNLPLRAAGKPLGILTLAYGAHLNASDAFAGLSVFDGERVSTDSEGKLGVRIGGSVVSLGEQSSAALRCSAMGTGRMWIWSPGRCRWYPAKKILWSCT